MPRRLSALALGITTLACVGCERSTAPFSGCVEIRGAFDPAAPGFIVSYKSGADPVATTAQLETKYGFAATHVYTALPGFAAQLSASALAGVRCEPVVATLSHDSSVTIATR